MVWVTWSKKTARTEGQEGGESELNAVWFFCTKRKKTDTIFYSVANAGNRGGKEILLRFCRLEKVYNTV